MDFTTHVDLDCSLIDPVLLVLSAAPVSLLLVVALLRVRAISTSLRLLLGVGLVLVGLGVERAMYGLLFRVFTWVLWLGTGDHVGCLGGSPLWLEVLAQLAASVAFGALALHLKGGREPPKISPRLG